jgi:hypothetical protein
MSMTSARSNLLGAMSDLLVRWERIKEQWDDPVSRDVEKNFIEQIEPRVRSAAAAMNQMSDVMALAMRECT